MQGAGGAALLSTAQASLREVFPREQQGMVQSLYIVVVVVGPTLGPAFGGWMTDNYSWPWIFYIKSPLGLVAAALVWRFLQDSTHQAKAKGLDWQGIGLLAVGLARCNMSWKKASATTGSMTRPSRACPSWLSSP